MVRLSVAELVRSMICHYSNLIEGHNTHPRDIDRALAADYSPATRIAATCSSKHEPTSKCSR